MALNSAWRSEKAVISVGHTAQEEGARRHAVLGRRARVPTPTRLQRRVQPRPPSARALTEGEVQRAAQHRRKRGEQGANRVRKLVSLVLLGATSCSQTPPPTSAAAVLHDPALAHNMLRGPALALAARPPRLTLIWWPLARVRPDCSRWPHAAPHAHRAGAPRHRDAGPWLLSESPWIAARCPSLALLGRRVFLPSHPHHRERAPPSRRADRRRPRAQSCSGRSPPHRAPRRALTRRRARRTCPCTWTATPPRTPDPPQPAP